jgi:hypothetical protein
MPFHQHISIDKTLKNKFKPKKMCVRRAFLVRVCGRIQGAFVLSYLCSGRVYHVKIVPVGSFLANSNKQLIILSANQQPVKLSAKSENSQDYAQKTQRNCTFMNLASGITTYQPII